MSIQRCPSHGDVNYFDTPCPPSFWELAGSPQRLLLAVFIRRTHRPSLPSLSSQKGHGRQGGLGEEVFPGCLCNQQDLWGTRGLFHSRLSWSPLPWLIKAGNTSQTGACVPACSPAPASMESLPFWWADALRPPACQAPPFPPQSGTFVQSLMEIQSGAPPPAMGGNLITANKPLGIFPEPSHPTSRNQP